MASFIRRSFVQSPSPNLSKAYISSQLSDAIVFSLLIIILLVRPTGIMGKKINEKV